LRRRRSKAFNFLLRLSFKERNHFLLVIPAALNSGAGQAGIQRLFFAVPAVGRQDLRKSNALDSGFRRNNELKNDELKGSRHLA